MSRCAESVVLEIMISDWLRVVWGCKSNGCDLVLDWSSSDMVMCVRVLCERVENSDGL